MGFNWVFGNKFKDWSYTKNTSCIFLLIFFLLGCFYAELCYYCLVIYSQIYITGFNNIIK